MRNLRQTKDRLRALTSVRQNQSAYAAPLFSLGILIPIFWDFVPDPIWSDYFWVASHARTNLIIISAAIVIPYSLYAWKAAFYVLFFTGIGALIASLYGFDLEYIGTANSAAWMIAAISLFRMGTMRRVGQQTRPKSGAFLMLLPIHSPMGILQAIFVPWHYARYETRVLVYNEEAWFVFKGKFRHLKRFASKLTQSDGADYVPLPDLTDEQRTKLDRLLKSRAIIGWRDCRKIAEIALNG